AVRLEYPARDGQTYGLNLIDTPGHVDFAYEVSHSLQACEGAILVVDATQGIEAQTLANVHLALREGLTLIPVLNKIDLPSAAPTTILDDIRLMGSGARAEPLELGVFRPQLVPVKQLAAGEVGYIATGLKSVRDAQVGDTVTTVADPAPQPLAGYQPAKSLVFAGIYPVSGEDYPLLRDALEKLHLNDASFTYEPESSVALGFAFRCGFL